MVVLRAVAVVGGGAVLIQQLTAETTLNNEAVQRSVVDLVRNGYNMELFDVRCPLAATTPPVGA